MINSKNVNDLFPSVKRAALELIYRMKIAGYDVGISSTFRDFEYQNYLFAKGRTETGPIITNAEGGGSFHNYGLAFDIFYNKEGCEDGAVLDTAGDIGTQMGLIWGGDFTEIIDKAHFQWSDNLTIADLKKGKRPADKLLLWEWISGKIEKIDISIDGKIYNINRILVNGHNYVELIGFIPAGYAVSYNIHTKIPSIHAGTGAH